ncbi:MAG: hypothetical protein ACRDTM_08420 [Micromonosporaceae bacterium]
MDEQPAGRGPGGQSTDRGWWDGPHVTYETGQRVQAVALVMLKHQIVPELGVCRACGRLPAAELPLFGLRCDVAVEQWRVTWATLRRLVDAGSAARERAPVPPTHERKRR